jgi:hypothetical protein
MDLAAWNFKYVTVFLFGLITIYLYARDKFNIPTYDKDLVGPFAQLPPQSLTMDSRYRKGLRTYLFLIIALYVAMSLVGPNIISVDPTIRDLIPQQFREAKELWPMAAATFLIYTGAAKDSSVVGRIELSIRQYAHKKAFIPDAVFGLAASLRNLDISHWLATDPSAADENNDRHAALTKLITPALLAKLERDWNQEGELATWVRANILFYAFERLFSENIDGGDLRMDRLVESAENKAVRDQLRKERARLAPLFDASQGSTSPDAEKTFTDIQRFLRDLSLTLAVLLSQAARNSKDLAERLERLGFLGVQDRSQSDQSFFVIGVTVSIVIGAFAAGLFLVISQVNLVHHVFFFEDIPILNGVVMIAIAVMIYIIAFRSIDYQRDKLIDSVDWSENLEGYIQTVVPASIVASVICLVTLILVYFAVNSVVDIGWIAFLFGTNSIAGLAEQGLRQFLLAVLASGFFVRYMREAARLPPTEARLRAQLLSKSTIIHAVAAAVLAAGFSYLVDVYRLHETPRKYHLSSMTSFAKIETALTAKDEKIWFSRSYTTSEVETIREKLHEIGQSWTAPNMVRNKDGERFDPGLAFFDRKLRLVEEVCDSLNKSGTDISLMRLPYRGDGHCNWKIPPAPKADAPPVVNEFDGFTAMLGELRNSLDKLKKYYESDSESQGRAFAVSLFPALVIFVVTYAFGVGSRFSRAWLLYKDAGRDNNFIAKFKEEVEKAYPGIDAARCLITPLSALDYLTPLEALRYPDYRAKLFAKVQKKKIVWPKECGGDVVPAATTAPESTPDNVESATEMTVPG